MLSVYSIVNTVLLNIPEISAVVLLNNGQQRPTFAGHLDTSRPLLKPTASSSRHQKPDADWCFRFGRGRVDRGRGTTTSTTRRVDPLSGRHRPSALWDQVQGDRRALHKQESRVSYRTGCQSGRDRLQYGFGPGARFRRRGSAALGCHRTGRRSGRHHFRAGRVGVIATESTIRSEAYERSLHRIRDDLVVVNQACPLFVPLVEEGWHNDPIAGEIAKRYLAPLVESEIDTLLLGCTHYPLLETTIREAIGNEVRIVDSAHAVADQVGVELESLGLEIDRAARARSSLLCHRQQRAISRESPRWYSAPPRSPSSWSKSSGDTRLNSRRIQPSGSSAQSSHQSDSLE